VTCIGLGGSGRIADAMLAACKIQGARVLTTHADNAGVRTSIRE
jgi:hypothetical protein